MTAAVRVDLAGRIGARTLFRIPRRLVRIGITLDEALAGAPPTLSDLPADAHGFLLTSLPERLFDAIGRDGLQPIVRQRYTRHFVDLTGGFDAYLAGFSSKSRATLLRKQRRFSEQSPDVRMYRTPAEIEAFERLARPLASRTYQERLLGAGLSDDLETMRSLAANDAVRAFILFRDDAPASYLYLPAKGRTLIYAYLGYDPDLAGLSPGNVLQLQALKMLMDEGRFDRLDFTEGDGQHKAVFATGGMACVDVLLLRPSLGNRAAAGCLDLFDRSVARLRGLGKLPLLQPLATAIRR